MRRRQFCVSIDIPMSVDVGTRLGSLEITALLGKGGMGEVYRARDTKLKRDVAVKILPDEFSRDADRVSRFQREAEVLASLNHPNIAAIYDLQEANGSRFLVLELIEGETLADRIARGPIQVEEALDIAKYICEALEAAHEKGIVHRDLKPGNVKITPEGKVKVLDFGLAKAMSGANASATARSHQGIDSAPANVNLSNSPTLPVTDTIAGMILGTAAYMSPEQVRGENTDTRSDVFSFGCVMYEMLTGRQAFQGTTVSDILASVLAREPDFSSIPPKINPKLPQLIRRAVEKQPKRRWQAIGDLHIELEAAMSDPFGSQLLIERTLPRRPLWKRAIPIVLTAVVVAAVTAAITWKFRPVRTGGLTRFSFAIPEGQRLTRGGRHLIALSPDGANLVYVADNQLYLRAMADREPRPIEGTNLDPDTPFFSPDGRWLAFHSGAENKFKKIPINGGLAVTICDSPLPYGASWSSDSQIFFGGGPAGILRVPANGGKPETVVSVKPNELASAPQLLPGGNAILFTLANGQSGDRWDKAQIVVQSLKSRSRTTLLDGGSDARYVPTGHIVYASSSTLLAFPYDIAKLARTGNPVPVIEGVLRAGGFGTGAAQFSFSASGSMVYFRGMNSSSGNGRMLALVDRSGDRKRLDVPILPYLQPRISPDGKQLVVSTDDGTEAAVWVYDLGGTTAMRKLTFEGGNRFPLWTRDGQRVVFWSVREGGADLFWQRVDGTGAAEKLAKLGQFEGIGYSPDFWSLDGKTLIFSSLRTNDTGLWSLSMERDSKATVLIDLPSTRDDSASISPDGHWLAYQSGDVGRLNIYVQTFPPTKTKYQLTMNDEYRPYFGDAIFPIWSPDGKQIFFTRLERSSGRTRLSSVDVQTQPSFAFGKQMLLPIEGFILNGGAGMPRGYDITPDGRQFLMMLPPSEPASPTARPPQIEITLNWFEELKQRAPVQ
jgi:eukaryotic-like serine/threonine-protein kinase